MNYQIRIRIMKKYIETTFTFNRNTISSHMSSMDVSFDNSSWLSATHRSYVSMKFGTMSFWTSLGSKLLYNSGISSSFHKSNNMKTFFTNTRKYIVTIEGSNGIVTFEIIIIRKFNHFFVNNFTCSFFMLNNFFLISQNYSFISVFIYRLITNNINIWHMKKRDWNQGPVWCNSSHLFFKSY